MSLAFAAAAEMPVADQNRDSKKKPPGRRTIIAKPDATLTPEAR